MDFDHSKLAGRIKEKFGSQKALAAHLGWPASKLSDRMRNKTPFRDEEIAELSAPSCLDIPAEDYVPFYFTPRF